ncbi:MAG: ATP synthase F0 subunit A [Candidatus Latescibacterota bacterium]|nr:MAG: ATP synthase F0 subunit A [Candidatus Latescibacterota bacterium]
MSKKLWIGLLIVLVVEVGLAWKADMTLHIGEVPQWRFVVKGHEVVVNSRTAITSWLVMGLLILSSVLIRRRLKQRPGRWQSVFELIVDFFDGLVRDTLGPGNRGHLPMIGSLFLFLWISNVIGVIPMLEEPTRDLNVPVGCMLVVLAVVHVSAIRAKGWKKYMLGYTRPFFIMFPLNVIGEMAKGVSLSFRLFGNILGGAIIIVVISSLVRYILLPVGLSLFFGIFVGTIQAFVFSMLALAYIAVAVSD